MPFNLFPILWRLLLLRMNKLLNFQYFFRNFTCNSPEGLSTIPRQGHSAHCTFPQLTFIYNHP